MAERDKVAAARSRCIVERTAAQLCAKRAGMAFFADVEHNISNVRFYKIKRYANGLCKFGDGGKVLVADAKVEHYGAKLEWRAAKALI